MKVIFEKSLAKGTVTAPPSKSVTHRALICAALSSGECLINGIDLSEDIKATIRAAKAIGAKPDLKGNSLCVTGTSGKIYYGGDTIDCGECASTLRFMIPILMTSKGGSFTGSKTLLSRPLSVYEDLCKKLGIGFDIEDGVLSVGGGLVSGDYSVPGNISSQFVTGLIFALSLFSEDSLLSLTGKTESRPYIDLTIDVLKSFGVQVSISGSDIYIKGGQKYNPAAFSIEGDWSNGAFLYAFNEAGGNLNIKGLSQESIQGDKAVLSYIEELNAPSAILDISDSPDLGPLLMALAAMKNGARLTGTKRLGLKESDRGKAMKEELEKFGIDVRISENSIDVSSGLKKPSDTLFSHNDHRIAMSLALLLSVTGGSLDGAEAVRKSWPDFYKVLKEKEVKLHYET